jgi:pimeloyl-ACP methyl ester carboxylesterase
MRLIDLQDVTRQVPIAPPPPGPARPPAFVLGGKFDTVVDVEGLEELAAAYGTTAVVVDGLAHDVMLDARWREVAAAVRAFADGL